MILAAAAMTGGLTGRDLWLLAAGFVLGWVALLIIKYDVIGLTAWDEELHPERLPCDVPSSYF